MKASSLLEYVEAYSFRAFEEFSGRNFPQALSTLAKALQIDPTSDLALLLRSDVWMATRRPRQAIRDLNALLAEHPDCLAGYFRRAEARLALGHWRAAVRDCSDVLQRDPRNTSALHLRAIIRVDRRQDARALDDLDRLLSVDADHIEGRIDRGFVRFLLGDLNGARGDLKLALEMRGAEKQSRDSAVKLLHHIRRILRDVRRRTG